MTTRRHLLIALGAAALAAPAASLGQRPKIPLIGYLDATSPRFAKYRMDRLRAGLRDLGYVEGKTMVIEARWAEENHERLPALAAELVAMKVDVIVAVATQAIGAARKATSTIPIVMTATADPVGAGFVASLARPGGNITGLSTVAADLSSKYLELLRAAVPKLSHVAVLTQPNHPNHPDILKNLQAAARATGIKVTPLRAGVVRELDAAVLAASRDRAGALIMLPEALYYAQAEHIASLAQQHHLPTLFWTREPVEAGAMMSYGQDVAEHYYRAATYVDKILKGAKPADLPIEQPTKIELVINLRTAKAIGITIPQNLLFRADRVIE